MDAGKVVKSYVLSPYLETLCGFGMGGGQRADVAVDLITRRVMNTVLRRG